MYEDQARNLQSESFQDEFDIMFDSITKDIEDDLKAKITTKVADDHPCMGSNPEVEVNIGVFIYESPAQLSSIQCAGAAILDTFLENAF